MASPGIEAEGSTLAPLTPPARGDRHKRHLRNYLLDKSLQLRYVAFVVTVSVTLTTALSVLLWRQATQASQTIRETMASPGMDWLAEETKAKLLGSLQTTDAYLGLTMLGVGVGLCIVLGIYLIVLTHKVAGPLYKIGYYFDSIRDGKLRPATELRNGDHLQDFFHQFKGMNDALVARTGREVTLYAELLAAAEAASVSSEALAELRALKEEREATLAA